MEHSSTPAAGEGAMDMPMQKALFGLSSRLTDRLPEGGARLLDATVIPILTSPELERRFTAYNEEALHRAGNPRRILVLSDIHLGDAVLCQSMVTALRDFFPEAEIHYVVSRAAACLVAGNREITKLHAPYTGGPVPSDSDMHAVRQICREGSFDLTVNACPFFTRGRPLPHQMPVLDFSRHAPYLLRNEQHPSEPNHLLYQAQVFLHRTLGRRFHPVRTERPRGVRLVLSEEARRDATAFLQSPSWPVRGPLVLLNPDTASPFTRPPFSFMARLMERLTSYPARLLIGEGHTDRGVGRRLIQLLPSTARSRVRLVPTTMKAETYAALTDLVDVFVSGDTGPLHWAAARKETASGRPFHRNRTFVVSLFGATPARMSGYDSSQAGFLPAWQDVPSVTFVSGPPCRNITCLNKLYKTCRAPRCFEGLEADLVFETIAAYLEEDRQLEGSWHGRGEGIPEASSALS
jgi:heptosyltransferase II